MKPIAGGTVLASSLGLLGLLLIGCPGTSDLLTQFTLNVTTSGPGSVDPSGGTFQFGQQVTLTATASQGARFDHWQGDASGNQNPLVVTMDSDKNITAVFSSEASESGTITSEGFSVLLLAVQGTTLENGTLSISIPLKNANQTEAQNVQITNLAIPGLQFLGPDTLPILIGTMGPDEIRTINALFSAPAQPQNEYALTIQGAFGDISTGTTFDLTGPVAVEVPNPGPTPATAGTTVKATPATATYPPTPPPPPADFEANEGNQQGIRPPLGAYRNLFAAAPQASTLDRTLAFAPKNQRQLQGNPVEFAANVALTAGGGLPPDPTIAGPDPSGFMMYGVNTRVAFSTNFGASFTDVPLTSAAGFSDPAIPTRTDFFPQDDGGLCCDQVILYIPAPRNIFVWLLQYNAAPIVIGGVNTTGPNRLRIAYATPQAAAADFLHAWTWFDITSAGVDLSNDWMDYPDLSFSNTFLYIGVDHGIQGSGNVRPSRHIFVRASLDNMLDSNANSVGYQFVNPTRGLLYQNHVVQTSNDTMYWAALPNTSTLVVYSWPDSANDATPHDIPVSTWCNADYTVTAPDGLNWNTAPTLALGATRTDPAVFCPPEGCFGPTRFLYFAWSAGRANPCTVGSPPQTITGRPFPYVRVAKVDRDKFTLVSEVDIWSPDFAFATPALVSRPGASIDDVAVSLAVGGGGNYADNAVGFLSDFVYYVTTDSNVTQSNGSVTRFGDWFNVRNSFGPVTANGQGVGFSTLSYAVRAVTPGQSCVTGGCNIVPHFVQFGRQGDLIPQPPPPGPR